MLLFFVLLTFMGSDHGSSGLCDGGKTVSECSFCFTACCTSSVSATSIIDEAVGSGGLLLKIFEVYFCFLALDISSYIKVHIQMINSSLCVSWSKTKTTVKVIRFFQKQLYYLQWRVPVHWLRATWAKHQNMIKTGQQWSYYLHKQVLTFLSCSKSKTEKQF